ncbi:methionine aminopeptidase 1D, mitochondrial-like [Planococcus citri]|uniref:methionine aminopeptidase 1D, mitochondrial-like n=1 Tax=Planococcus citri TaxID=170843 RepID=UPI0031F99041
MFRQLIFSVTFILFLSFQQILSRVERKYEPVAPLDVSPPLSVPEHIPRPEYVYTGKDEKVPRKILIKNATEIAAIAESCIIARDVLKMLGYAVRVGTTTDELDARAHQLIKLRGAYPSPLNYSGFPKSICASVNNIFIHGIPDSRPLRNGDIVTLDISVYYKGYHGDCAETFLVGKVDEAGRKLVLATRNILQTGIDCCGPGVPFYTIGHRIAQAAAEKGYVVMPQVLGHGIGRYFHEKPDIVHDESASLNAVMKPGMIFTIEPAIGEGTRNAMLFPDKWSITTEDYSRAAHAEHTILITEKGHKILTK